jgi:hypothetical protein
MIKIKVLNLRFRVKEKIIHRIMGKGNLIKGIRKIKINFKIRERSKS